MACCSSRTRNCSARSRRPDGHSGERGGSLHSLRAADCTLRDGLQGAGPRCRRDAPRTYRAKRRSGQVDTRESLGACRRSARSIRASLSAELNLDDVAQAVANSALASTLQNSWSRSAALVFPSAAKKRLERSRNEQRPGVDTRGCGACEGGSRREQPTDPHGDRRQAATAKLSATAVTASTVGAPPLAQQRRSLRTQATSACAQSSANRLLAVAARVRRWTTYARRRAPRWHDQLAVRGALRRSKRHTLEHRRSLAMPESSPLRCAPRFACKSAVAWARSPARNCAVRT